MRARTSIRAGGWALIFGAIAFMGVFSFLAARFDYPAVLDGPASLVLPRLLATGAVGRAVAIVASANNYLLPLWMIGFGVLLLRIREAPDAAAGD